MKPLNIFTLLLVLSFVSCIDNKDENKKTAKTITSGTKFKNLQGVLDTSFGNSGIVLHHNAAFGGADGIDHGQVIKVNSYGDILVCGKSTNGNNFDLVIWKYSSNGVLDENFGSGGIVKRHNIAGGKLDETCSDLILNEDGSFYVTGESSNTNNDMDVFILKFKSNGAPDYNFGLFGSIYYNNSTGALLDDSSKYILKNSKDDLFLVGTSYKLKDGSTRENVIIRKYFASGSRDTTFGLDGNLNIDTYFELNNNSTVYDAKLLSNEKVVMLGLNTDGGIGAILVRLNSDGSPDQNFGAEGIIDFDQDDGTNSSICHATNDYVLYSTYKNLDSHLYKMKSDGDLDPTFGDDGSVLIENVDYNKCLRNDQGDIFIVAFDNNSQNVAIYKFLSNGIIDESFGEDGFFNLNLVNQNNSIIENATFSKDGSILVTGWVRILDKLQMFIFKVK